MRPQVAMAALLLLMVGSSLLLLRGRPGSGQVGVVRVTEQGVPQPDRTPASVPAPEVFERDKPSAAAPDRPSPKKTGTELRAAETRSSDHDEPLADAQSEQPTSEPAPPKGKYDEAMARYKANDYRNAFESFDEVAAEGGPNAASAALYAAKSVRASAGCSNAIPRYQAIPQRFPGTAAALQSKWEVAACARIIGNFELARRNYLELRETAGQRERADRELSRISRSKVAAPSSRDAPASSSSF